MQATTMSYRELRAVCEQRAAREGLAHSDAVMQTMTLGVLAVAGRIPAELRPALFVAGTRWLTTDPVLVRLEPFRVQAWEFLERKNGDSASVRDQVDVAVRALLCVLWEDETAQSLDELLAYFTELLGSHEGVVTVLRAEQ